MNKQESYDRIEKHYRENKDLLLKYYGRVFNGTSLVEDVVQEAYTRALTYWKTMPEDEEKFTPWLRTIVSNCIREMWKKENVHGMGMDEDNEPEPIVPPSAIPAIIYKQVMERIEGQEPRTRRILGMFFHHQMLPKEIEQMTGEKANNVRQIVFQFRKHLKEDFQWP